MAMSPWIRVRSPRIGSLCTWKSLSCRLWGSRMCRITWTVWISSTLMDSAASSTLRASLLSISTLRMSRYSRIRLSPTRWTSSSRGLPCYQLGIFRNSEGMSNLFSRLGPFKPAITLPRMRGPCISWCKLAQAKWGQWVRWYQIGSARRQSTMPWVWPRRHSSRLLYR
jgi:hypothetical protein